MWEGAEKTSSPRAAGKGKEGLGGQELEELNFFNSVVWIPASEPELFTFSPPDPPPTHTHIFPKNSESGRKRRKQVSGSLALLRAPTRFSDFTVAPTHPKVTRLEARAQACQPTSPPEPRGLAYRVPGSSSVKLSPKCRVT